MRIAQIAPPWVAVPPTGYGGIERIISQLTEELVRRGHEVTLFATGDSKTSATLSSYYKQAIGNDGYKKGNAFTTLLHTFPAFARASSFDIIHSHDPMTVFFGALIKTPIVHTIHGTLVEGEIDEGKRQAYQLCSHLPFASISNNQRKGLPELTYVSTVYNGIDMNEFTYSDKKGTYLAWFGRITPKKGVVEAIRVARKVGIPLKIAAVIDPIDQQFFDRFVKPEIDNATVHFIGELTGKDRSEFLKNALALLFPIRWHEPFGLVMIESMACGTPVIATNFGSTSEVIEDGVTGYIVEGSVWDTRQPISNWQQDDVGIITMEKALRNLLSLDEESYKAMRKACRDRVERLFTVSSMVDGYEKVYKHVIAREKYGNTNGHA